MAKFQSSTPTPGVGRATCFGLTRLCAETMLRGSAAWSQAAPGIKVPVQRPPICLNVSDHWDNLHTKSYSFTGILRSDALTLENLRELTACRAQAYENSSVTTEERLSWQVAFLREQGQHCLDHVSFGTRAM